MRDYSDISIFLLRISLSILLGYFGLNAIIEPQMQADLWMSAEVSSLIPIPIVTFMLIFGIIQTITALALLTGFYPRIAALAMAVMLVGIIYNLYPSTSAGRNAVILTAALVVASSKNHIYSLKVTKA